MLARFAPQIRFAAALAILAALGGGHALASDIPLSFVRASGDTFAGAAVDPASGKFYQHNGYSGEAAVLEFADAAAFAAGAPAGTFSLASGIFGSYFSASNGALFYRLDGGGSMAPGSTAMGQAAVTTGALLASTSGIPGMGGLNRANTFDWGGYTTVNVFQDGTGLYVVGGAASPSTDWIVAKIDTALNVIESKTFSPTVSVDDASPGFGFFVNGRFFYGADYYTNAITGAFDFAAGLNTATSFTLTGGPSTPPYWTNAFYDPLHDTVYLQSARSFYRFDDAAATLGVTAVPEPSTWIMALAGFALAGWVARRRTRRINWR